ncbi:MAG TPA: hypothetical protein VEX41_03535, partial [Candidatus Eisenbacteria bacterium]|nr:hypothetical protein [Candidatus Eisenbacteria bacterium]
LQVLAAELRLLEAGGSDYHGDRGTYAEAHARLWVPPSVEAPLRAAIEAAHASRGRSAAAEFDPVPRSG